MYLLVWFLPFFVFCLTFCGYFHCWVVIIFCTRSHTHTITLTQTFLGGVSSLHPLIAIFFPVILLVFFCCCATTAVLHLYTHFPCLSILFLSNMLLADTLFSSLSPIIFAVTAAALFRCVSISVSSLCHADNYFALTLNLSNRAQIGTDSTQTIAVAFTATVVCEGHLLCRLCTNTHIRLIR